MVATAAMVQCAPHGSNKISRNAWWNFATFCINSLWTLLWNFCAQSGEPYPMDPNKHYKICMVQAGWLHLATQFGWMPGYCWSLRDGQHISAIRMTLTVTLLVQWLTMHMLRTWGKLRAWSTRIPSTAWIKHLDLWSVRAYLRALEGARRLQLRSLSSSSWTGPTVPLTWITRCFYLLLYGIAPVCSLQQLCIHSADWFDSIGRLYRDLASLVCLAKLTGPRTQTLQSCVSALEVLESAVCRCCPRIARLMDHRRRPLHHMRLRILEKVLSWIPPALRSAERSSDSDLMTVRELAAEARRLRTMLGDPRPTSSTATAADGSTNVGYNRAPSFSWRRKWDQRCSQ